MLCHKTYEKALHAWTETEASRICKMYGICKVKVCCHIAIFLIKLLIGLIIEFLMEHLSLTA